jgi:hypothetical protein
VPILFRRLYGRLGLSEALTRGISGHSARIGGAQDLLIAGASLVGIMNAGGWTSTTMPALYTRDLNPGEGAMARMLREHPRPRARRKPSRSRDEEQ